MHLHGHKDTQLVWHKSRKYDQDPSLEENVVDKLEGEGEASVRRSPTHPPTHTHFLRASCSSHLRLARSIIAPRIADHLIGSQNAVNLWAEKNYFDWGMQMHQQFPSCHNRKPKKATKKFKKF